MQDVFPLTVFTMMLGEINFIDLFVEADNRPFTADAYILLTVFMILMPIALMNLLVIPTFYSHSLVFKTVRTAVDIL